MNLIRRPWRNKLEYKPFFSKKIKKINGAFLYYLNHARAILDMFSDIAMFCWVMLTYTLKFLVTFHNPRKKKSLNEKYTFNRIG